jgi:hypothetical protein
LSLYLSGVFIGRIGVGLEEKSAAVKIDIFSILTDSSGKPTMRSKKNSLQSVAQNGCLKIGQIIAISAG